MYFLQFVSLGCYICITITPLHFISNKAFIKKKILFIPLTARFSLHFELGASHFYFTLGPANYVVGPAFLYLTYKFFFPLCHPFPFPVCKLYPFIDLDF